MTETIHTPINRQTTTRPARRDHERRLRTVLRINAISSLASGVVLAVAPHRVDELLDTGHPEWVRVAGVALLPFAALCAWVSTASVATLRRMTPEIVVADVAWVVASVATVIAGWYSGAGVVAVLAMAAAVDTFAVLQWTSWRRLPTTR